MGNGAAFALLTIVFLGGMMCGLVLGLVIQYSEYPRERNVE